MDDTENGLDTSIKPRVSDIVTAAADSSGPRPSLAAIGPSAPSIEQRLGEIESKLDRLIELASAQTTRRRRTSLPALFRRAVKPRLWTYEQYSPRALRANWPDTNSIDRHLPSFAIVTPSYNQGAFVGQTINSVLRQDKVSINYLVQDGASTDGTLDELRKFDSRLNWVSVPDRGQSDAIMRGFANLPGDIMGWLNSDDMLMPGALARIAEIFANRPDVDVVYGDRIYIDANGLDVGRCVLPPHDIEAIKWSDFIPQETMFWRRSVWDATGGLREDFHYALDWDFILRASALGFRFLHVAEFIGCFRVHDAQKTTSMMDLGEREMQRLRTEHLGFAPQPQQINEALSPYMKRHLAVDAVYRLTGRTMNLPGFLAKRPPAKHGAAAIK